MSCQRSLAVTKAFLPSMIRSVRLHHQRNVFFCRKERARTNGVPTPFRNSSRRIQQVLADEVRYHGIRVNSVNRGRSTTDMRHAAYPDEDWSTLKKPAEVTDVFVFLASDRSRGTTGEYFDALEYLKTNKEIA